MKERRSQIAGTLSGGEQQMVAIGRALMARPKLLCMDEPSMGLSPIFVEQVFDIIQEINRQGTTIFMVEQNANMALSIAHRAYVLQTGQVVLSGTAAELRQNPTDPRGLSRRDAGGGVATRPDRAQPRRGQFRCARQGTRRSCRDRDKVLGARDRRHCGETTMSPTHRSTSRHAQFREPLWRMVSGSPIRGSVSSPNPLLVNGPWIVL